VELSAIVELYDAVSGSDAFDWKPVMRQFGVTHKTRGVNGEEHDGS